MSMPRYSTYKSSGVEWLGEVPSYWDIAPIKTVASCNDDVLPESTPEDFEIEYVEISDVDASLGIVGRTRLDFESAPSRARRIVKDGDVLVSTVRTYLRAIAPVAHPPDNMIASTGFAVVRPRSVYSGFLGYAFRAEYLVSQVIARSTGISYPAINASELMRLKIPLPPHSEQIQITAFLARETNKIDALITAEQELIELLKEKRRALVASVVTKGLNPAAPMKDSGFEWLGKVPAHWTSRRLKWLLKQQKRQGFPDKEVLSVYRDYGVIQKDSRADNFNKTPEDLTAYQLVERGDLVVNKMKAWQGSLGISALEGITSPDYVVFEPCHGECPEYLHILLRSQPLVSTYLSISNGIRPAQWRLEPDVFLSLKVMLPPQDEQRAIAEFVREATDNMGGLIEEAEAGIAILAERRTALISAAVTGKIDVRGLVEAHLEEVAAE